MKQVSQRLRDGQLRVLDVPAPQLDDWKVLVRTQASLVSAGTERAKVEGAVHAVQSGPLGANGVPGSITLPNGHTVPFNPLKDVAFHALSNAYSIAYVVCGVAALTAALIAAVILGGRSHTSDFGDPD